MSKNLKSEAEKRKERLSKLKRSISKDADAPTLRFRSYEPETQDLQQFVAEAPQVGPMANTTQDTVEKRVDQIQAEALEASSRKINLDLENLVPKKPNWDLKRGIEAKLELLDKKTDAVIADLIRQRIKEQGDLSQIALL